ncbi:Protein of unknown function [Desulfocicer vacuolatum DSM 3385]|uniref:J domain-containing protein n=2 Tax=Desulfocicer vacuolatum TaxID=2298 RepID=A0A1W2E2Q3_9BACT|nr:Protein of unknown function [Desulfocicer vacuolatum DSM 3385]
MSQMAKFFIILAVVIYVISPFDLIPDFLMPFIGWIDDTVLISMLIYYLRTGKIPGIFSRKGNFQARYRPPGSQGNTTGGENHNTQQGSFSQSSQSHRQSWAKEPSEGEKSPHDILGVSPDATPGEIREAYITLAKQYHPDKVAHLGEELQILAEKRFKEIQQAYARLS